MARVEELMDTSRTDLRVILEKLLEQDEKMPRKKATKAELVNMILEYQDGPVAKEAEATIDGKDVMEIALKAGILYRIDSSCWWGKTTKVRDGEIDAPKEIISGMKVLVDPKTLGPMRSLIGYSDRILKNIGYSFIGMKGVYWIPKAFISRTDERVSVIEGEFSQARKEFFSNYELYKKEWRIKSKEYYDPDAYPAVGDFERLKKFKLQKRKFSISLPEKGTGVLTDAEYNDEKKKQIDEMKEFFQDTISVLAGRFYKMVKSLKEKLDSGKPVKQKTLDAMKEFGKTFDAFNVTGHKELKSLVTECFGVLGTADIEDLNLSKGGAKNDLYRAKMIKGMDAVVDKFDKSKDERLTRALEF